MFSPTYTNLVLLWCAFGALSSAALLAISWEEWKHAVKTAGYLDPWDIWIRSIQVESRVNSCPLWGAVLGFLSGPIALVILAHSIVQALWSAREELA
jgi:hypothetical protein